jgi:lysozyme family protein
MATYPWLAFSTLTRDVQREINTLRVRDDGKCPILVEDGKLGPATCSAVKIYAPRSGTIAAVLSSCKSFNDAAISNCLTLPWLQPSLETITFQKALNAVLVKQGYCKILEDGVMGPETCGAAQQVLGATFTQVGCKTPAVLKMCAAAASPASPIAPVPVTTTETTPVTVQVAPEVPSPDDTAPSADVTTPVAPSAPSADSTAPVGPSAPPSSSAPTTEPPPPPKSSALWVAGGLAAAGLVGLLVWQKKRKGRK